jgi:hypothetical protein
MTDSPLTIDKLKRYQCRYAVGDEEGTYIFCGEPVRDADCSYCAPHAELCLRQPRDWGGTNLAISKRGSTTLVVPAD